VVYLFFGPNVEVSRWSPPLPNRWAYAPARSFQILVHQVKHCMQIPLKMCTLAAKVKKCLKSSPWGHFSRWFLTNDIFKKFGVPSAVGKQKEFKVAAWSLEFEKHARTR
jgi:hypothetical protein